jgi:hypothetical protein
LGRPAPPSPLKGRVGWVGRCNPGLKPISLHTNSSGQGGRNLVPNT